MSLSLYNTLTKKKEKFISQEKGRVKMYTCGPTVYDYASIGNMWSYLTADILRRYLEYLGYEVRQVKNITDVGHFTEDSELELKGEDKLEKTARRENKDPLEIANYYLNRYLKDEKKLNIKKPHFQPRPTQEIEEIIKFIAELLKKGFAYQKDDGVYFSINKFPDYGKLSGNLLSQTKAGSRIAVNENKIDPADFVLWVKRVGPNVKHVLYWKSPWGDGFPGWHIECSAMIIKYLGDTIDIHTGGEDNIFPHHECEIAQSEAYTGKKFVHYWVHTRHLKINGEKMSKSLGNIYVISKTADNKYLSLEEMGYPPLVFRTLKLASHYRSKTNFSQKSLNQARKNWEKINEFYKKISRLKEDPEKQSLDLLSPKIKFEQALDDDLNTPVALKIVLALIKEGNRLLSDRNLGNPSSVKKFIEDLDKVLGILEPLSDKKNRIPEDVEEIAQERESARRKRDFPKADELRSLIEKKGFKIEDTESGYDLSPL